MLTSSSHAIFTQNFTMAETVATIALYQFISIAVQINKAVYDTVVSASSVVF
jgi:hypothetical protein